MNNIKSSKNKETLWNLLYQNNIFDNIPNQNIEDIKNIFESTINNILENNTSSCIINLKNNLYNDTDIMNTNKILLLNLKNNISDEKERFHKNSLKSESTKDDLRNLNLNTFNVSLKERSNSFEELINQKKPIEISFNDINSEDGPINNDAMNSMLEKMQNERDLLLDIPNPPSTNVSTNVSSNALKEELVVDLVDDIVDNSIIDLIDKNKKHDNIIMSEPILNKPKITSIEHLIDEDLAPASNTYFKKRNSKVDTKDINYVMQEEYKSEYTTNLNHKMDTMITKMNTLSTKLDAVLDKVAIDKVALD
jgi:hypothetical protein